MTGMGDRHACLHSICIAFTGAADVLGSVQVVLYAIRAAETPMLDYISEAEEVEGVVHAVSGIMCEAVRAAGSPPQVLQLAEAVLALVAQFAAPLLQHLGADEETQPHAQVNTSTVTFAQLVVHAAAPCTGSSSVHEVLFA